MSKDVPPSGPIGQPWYIAEKIPWLLAALVGIVTWCIEHTVEVVVSSPTIEFRKSVGAEEGNETPVTFTISNISRSRVFENLSFYVDSRSSAGSSVKHASFKARPPAKLPDGNAEMPKSQDKALVSYRIPQMQPGWEFNIHTLATDPDAVTLSFDIVASEDAAQNDKPAVVAVRLVEDSAETFVAKHELAFLLGTIIGGVLLIGLYLCLIRGRFPVSP